MAAHRPDSTLYSGRDEYDKSFWYLYEIFNERSLYTNCWEFFEQKVRNGDGR